MRDRLGRVPAPLATGALAVVVALPLIVAVVALAQRRWYPVLDLAMTEIRLRDVGTGSTPLVGLPGRIGELPDQGSHPGPLSFWALAPGYRLLGGSAWAMEASTVVLALGWAAVAIWIGRRRAGLGGALVVAAVVAIAVAGYGASVLTQPWNPYLPLLAWLVVLLSTWSVLDGDDAMLVPLVVAASYAAGTHIPYLSMAGGLGVLALCVAVVRRLRSARIRGGDPRGAHRTGEGGATGAIDGGRRGGGASWRWPIVTAGAFVALWAAPVVEQIRGGDDGNLVRLLDHFGSPSEDAIGWVAGARLALRHLDVASGFVPLLTGGGRFVEASSDSDGPVWSAIAVLVAFVASFVVAVRLGHRSLVHLHLVLAVALGATVVSMSRIFGVRWFYLTLWAWITTTLVLVAIAWTTVAALRGSGGAAASALAPERLSAAAVAVIGVVTVVSCARAPATDHPEAHLGEPVGVILDEATAALDPRATHVVRFQDASFFGSQAFGLVSELRRAGFDARMDEFWEVPITPDLTVAEGAPARELRLVTGVFVERGRADADVEVVASADVRSPEERAIDDGRRAALIADLRADGLDDLVAAVDENLFAVTSDPRISERAQALSADLLLSPRPVALLAEARR
ncbi:hypothetical protein [Ilumatobacter sp.]|uniref:hypothetical protein n=1 Tax=Ilumatobacter sp. TaxID=1967498 RepID=UPI003B52F86C